MNTWKEAMHISVPEWLLDSQEELQSKRYESEDAKMQLVHACAERNYTETDGAPLAAAIYTTDGQLISVGVDAEGMGGHEMTNALLLAQSRLGPRAKRVETQWEMYSLAPPCMICLGNIYSEQPSTFVYSVEKHELLQHLSLPNTPFPQEDWIVFLKERGIQVKGDVGKNSAMELLQSFAEDTNS